MKYDMSGNLIPPRMSRDIRPYVLVFLTLVAGLLAFAGPGKDDDRVLPSASGKPFALKEVQAHASDDDCWVMLDGSVFDLTSQSRMHPSLFNCGKDVSENYHENHGPVVRPQMLKFKIGELDEESRRQTAGVPSKPEPEKPRTIVPSTQLFAEIGSWDPLDLMVVMERDNRSLLFIDSSKHKAVGRITDIGERVHTQVFSPDGRLAYHISRDGWLTKIDLRSLKVIGMLKVGTDSRGTAIVGSGKYVAVGNYEPRDVVIVDTQALSEVARIPLTDDEGKGSRAGGLVDSGERFVVSLKDGRSVWVIEAAAPFAVLKKFTGIGQAGDVLHDAFLTPDGGHFLTAVQGSDDVWVLDVKTMEPVGEVRAGKTPHTGPGATWGDLVFVPSLGENALAAIDMKTWKLRDLVRTTGAGLFVRSYAEDPAYPYVWTDSAFGQERQDTIDVIDARSLRVARSLVPMEGKRAVHPEFTPDGRFVYVAVWGGDKVFVYDARTFKAVAQIDAFTPSGISSVGIRIHEPGL